MKKTTMEIEEIARPRIRLPFIINTATLYIKAKELVAAVDYSSSGRDAALFLIDVNTMADHKYPLPEGVNGFGFVQATDGNLYLGAKDELYRFDTEKRTLGRVGRLFDEGKSIWGGLASSLGKVYMGVYPTGEFCEYDIRTGSVKKFNPFPGKPLGLYAARFIELPDKNILIFVWGAKPAFLLYNPYDGKCATVYSGSPENEGTGFFMGFFDQDRVIVTPSHRTYLCKNIRLFNWKQRAFDGDMLPNPPESIVHLINVEGAWYGCGYPSGKIYKIKDGNAQVVYDGFPEGNLVYMIHHLKGDEFAGLGDNGLFVKFNVKTHERASFQIHNESDHGMCLHFLAKVPDKDWVVGGHFIDMQLFKVNLKSKVVQSSLHKIAPYIGQVMDGIAFKDKFYLGSYGKAVIYSLDVEKDFAYGENPRIIGLIPEEQNRPGKMVQDGRFIYIPTMASYGALGGAITVLDPATNQMETYRHFVRDQNPISLYYDPIAGLLAGSTDIYGDCKTHAPTAEHACIFLWDPRQRKTIHTSCPWETDALRVNGMSDGGKLIGVDKKRYFLFDIASRQYEVKEWPLPGLFIGGVFMNDKDFYGATEHGLFVLDITNNQYSMLTKTTKLTGSYLPHLFTRISGHEFLFDIQGYRLMRARINK